MTDRETTAAEQLSTRAAKSLDAMRAAITRADAARSDAAHQPRAAHVADGEAAPAPRSGAGSCVARDRVGRGPGLVQDPCPERPHLGPLPGGRRGDEAATFGRLGPAVEERDQRPARQSPAISIGRPMAAPSPVTAAWTSML